MLPLLAAAALALVPAAAAGEGLMESLQQAMLYQPSRALFQEPEVLKVPYEEVSVESADGEKLFAWFFPLSPEAPVVIFSHGNGGNISSRLMKVKLLQAAGASVLMYDYRGYGRSTGRPSEQGTYLDALAYYDWLALEKKVPAGRIVSYGESLGAAVATELAMHRPLGGLVLESAFTSVVDMAKEKFPLLPLHRSVTFRYDTLWKIPRLHWPLLVMHSPTDEIVPFSMGKRLFEAAPEPKTFVELAGGHNDGFLKGGAAYSGALRAFLTAVERAAKDVEGLPPPVGAGEEVSQPE